MDLLSPNEKGALAEARLAAAAIEAGLVVARPVLDARFDLIFGFPDGRLERVQCKWGRLLGDVISIRTSTCRHSPTRG